MKIEVPALIFFMSFMTKNGFLCAFVSVVIAFKVPAQPVKFTGLVRRGVDEQDKTCQLKWVADGIKCVISIHVLPSGDELFAVARRLRQLFYRKSLDKHYLKILMEEILKRHKKY